MPPTFMSLAAPVAAPTSVFKNTCVGVSCCSMLLMKLLVPPPTAPMTMFFVLNIGGLPSPATVAPYGIPAPDDGLLSRVRRAGEVPLQDVGFIAAVRGGKVTPVAAVTGFDGDKVLLADGTAISPQAVIAATGYRRGLEKMAGHLGVLDESGMPKMHGGQPAAPGLSGCQDLARNSLKIIRLNAFAAGSAAVSGPASVAGGDSRDDLRRPPAAQASADGHTTEPLAHRLPQASAAGSS